MFCSFYPNCTRKREEGAREVEWTERVGVIDAAGLQDAEIQ